MKNSKVIIKQKGIVIVHELISFKLGCWEFGDIIIINNSGGILVFCIRVWEFGGINIINNSGGFLVFCIRVWEFGDIIIINNS